ncbi:MAG: polymerase III, alpha subunit protein [Parcubacteria group bacterium GW2011_GWB1_43_8]|nr:MAG: polymerase III, alpha subunit protein [Parcubacteria group bacterium GW2011_GWB1_43_8]
MPSKFVHLHTHSHYSLLDGLIKIDDLVDEAVKLDMPAIALTDHGNMYGTIEFYKKCHKAGIKPIIGVETYIALESMLQKRPNIDNKRHHLILLAKNETGYKNLLKIVTASYLEGYYYKPRVDKEFLRKHHEGLVALSACMAGEVSKMIERKDPERAEKAAREYEDIFGKGNFYIEISHHPDIENHSDIQKGLVELARKTNIPLVATQDVHYLKPADAMAQDILVAIQTNAELADANRLTMKLDDFSMKSGEEMEKLFRDIPDAVENTFKIAEMCDVKLSLGKWVFPKLDIEGNKKPEEFLIESARQNYLKIFGADDTDGEVKKRLEYELEVITSKGYAPYFLIVADLINFARSQKIITNTRGSAAGSVVSYVLGITNVDPIKYALPFERFLNPYRPSPPDIDMDFADDRREEILEYTKRKYGKNHVAQIGTFGTMMARGSVRDITRALGKPYELGDRISKLIPMGSQGFPMTIDQALSITPELAEIYKKESEVKEIIDIAKKIEGGARHVSVHAAGVVISPTDLTDYTPLQFEPNGDKIITQYDMYSVEEAGLLKMDFLGIKNLSTLGNSVELVRQRRGIEIDIEKIPLDDKNTFEHLAKGETIGLFQLGGSGMTRYLKELRPTTVTDIMAMIALFRPGPMANIPTYIKRKHGREKITYPDPRLEKILDKTYGVVTYQDDVLLIAIELAGYNWDTVDKFRKAIGKKIPEEMAKQEKIFIEGCQKHGGLSLQKAEELWQLFDPFKGYGFNKAHAASYAKVAYQTAYMKANYPAEFMAAVLTADAGEVEKIAETIGECVRMKLPVLPPDVNESLGDFTVIKTRLPDGQVKEEEGIRFGLYTIKNLGKEIADAVIEEREKNGRYKSFADFLDRVQHKNLNKKSLESLIKSGAMDAFGERNKLIFNTEDALAYNKESGKAKKNQNSLFALMTDNASLPELRFKETEPASQHDRLLWEKELLGLYVSGHPLDKFKDKLEKIKTKIGDIKNLPDNMPLVTAGMIEEAKKINTKKGDPMIFMKLSDYADSIENVVFPKVFEKYASIIREGNCVAVKGRHSVRNGEHSILVEEIKEMADAEKKVL